MADLEAGGSHSSRRQAGHTHHGPARTEEDLSSTAVVWDNDLREWRSQEEEVEGRSLRSRSPELPHGRDQGLQQVPAHDDERLSEVTVADGAVTGEKAGRRDSVAMDPLDSAPSSSLAAKELGDGQPIWLEWEKGDPENPFNVRATYCKYFAHSR